MTYRLLQVTLLGCIAAAIIPGQQPTFDAASVKMVKLASHPVFANRGGPGTSDPGRVHICCVGMFSLLMRAYDVEIDQIVGPPWIMENMGPDLYQVDATMPPDTTKAQYQAMMQELLRERFHLEFHREKRNFPGYELLIAEGGPKLRESKPDQSDAGAQDNAAQFPKRDAEGMLLLPPGPQMFTSLGRGTIIIQAKQKTVADLAKALGKTLNQALGENPNDFAAKKARVIDRTGLNGTYDFTLKFACELCQFAVTNGAGEGGQPPAADSPSGEPGIFAAVQRQLGLKLKKVKDVSLDVIVVDRVDRTPTAN